MVEFLFTLCYTVYEKALYFKYYINNLIKEDKICQINPKIFMTQMNSLITI